MKNKISENWILYVAIFVMGGCGLAYQYTLSKIASDLLGNSVRQWAITIAVMMFFMGVGAEIQKYIKNKGLLDKFIIAEIFLGLLGGFGPIALLASYGSALSSYYALIQYFFICSIGLLIGFEIPLLSRINETYNSKLGDNLGNVLKMDYIGSLFGALFWVFILPKFYTLIEMGFVLGLFNLFVAGLSLWVMKKQTLHFKSILSFLIVSIAALFYGFTQSPNWTSYSEQNLYRDRIIFSTTTPYQHIVLTKSKTDDIACYINGHLQFNSFDEHIYHENLTHPIINLLHKTNPSPKRILVLGGGDGLAVRELLKYSYIKEIVLVDLDPEMTRLAQENPYFLEINKGSLKSPKITVQSKLPQKANEDIQELTLIQNNQHRPYAHQFDSVASVKVINFDALMFLENTPGLFDGIILDFPDPNSPELAKLYSKEFYSLLLQRLAPAGLIVQQSTSPIFAKEAYLSIGRTYTASGYAVIPYHDNVPTFGEWGFWIGGNVDYWNEESIKQNLNSLGEFGVETRYLNPDLVRASLIFGKEQLETEEVGITHISQSTVFEYYEQGWLQ